MPFRRKPARSVCSEEFHQPLYADKRQSSEAGACRGNGVREASTQTR